MKNILILLFIVTTAAFGQKAPEYLQTAIEKHSNRDYKGAIADYSKVIELENNNSEAYLNRGNCKFQIGEVQAAIADYNKTIALNPKNVKAYYSRAVSYASLSKYKEGLKDAEKVVELDASTPSCMSLRGRLRIMTGNKKGACEDFTAAKKRGDKAADQYIAQYCTNQQEMTEMLRLKWPKAEKWSIGENQDKGQIQVKDLVRLEVNGAGWKEIANMTTIRGLKDVKMDTAMMKMFAQAQIKSSDAKLTLIEKDETAKFPWILFTIEASKFYNNTPPESQLWYIVQGKEALYTNFRAMKKPSLPADVKKKWAKFFKTGKIVKP